MLRYNKITKMSITDIKEFIKSQTRNKDVIVIAIIVLSSAGAFALGRLSSLEHQGILIEQRALVHDVFEKAENEPSRAGAELLPVAGESGSVVASKSGTKYHFPWCAGARSIKEENKIWFATIEEARTAGYAPAANCKGLK